MTAKDRPANPKLRTSADRQNWFRYYAGYTLGFVRDTLAASELAPSAVVLDPWNGAGTTTFAAHQAGHRAVGFDRNPVMCYVAQARFATAAMVPDLRSAAQAVREDVSEASPPRNEDVLDCWFGPRTVAWIAAARDSIRQHPASSDGAKTVRALLTLALFETVRAASVPQATTNPTWFKQRRLGRKIGVPQNVLAARFSKAVESYTEKVVSVSQTAATHQPVIAIAPSEALPLANDSVDAVVTSPPYCTRIDYAVATLPELLALGVSPEEIGSLRRRLLGTPLTTATPKDLPSSPRLTTFLDQVAAHSSKAADTYYWRFFADYYSGLNQSLGELRRVLKPGARATVVVQDSYFKELLNPLADILVELAAVSGLELLDRHDYHVARTKVSMNMLARSYRDDAYSATESGLVLKKAA